MSVQKILAVQNSLLREKSKPVKSFDKRIEKLIADMTDTLVVQKNPIGVGLAAPQIGKPLRLFIVKNGKKVLPFINPEITWKSRETNDPKSRVKSPAEGEARQGRQESRVGQPKSEIRSQKSGVRSQEYIMEGCLSLPHFYGPVQRADKIKVKYQQLTTDYQLLTTEKMLKGLAAQIVQHEVDHLNGVLFVDRLLSQKRKLYKWTGKEWEEVELP